jgi:hypothetical protein
VMEETSLFQNLFVVEIPTCEISDAPSSFNPRHIQSVSAGWNQMTLHD